MKIRKIRKLIAISCLAFGAAIFTGLTFSVPGTSVRSVAQPAINVQSYLVSSDRITTTISSEHLSRCLPDNATNARRIVSQDTTEEAGGVTHQLSYHLFKYSRQGRPQQAVILDYRGICGLAYDSRLGLTMSETMPMRVAQSLTLQDYQASAAALGGVNNLRQSIIGGLAPSLDGTLPRFAPERVWALTQLDIHLPEDSYTIREITPYEPGQLTR